MRVPVIAALVAAAACLWTLQGRADEAPAASPPPLNPYAMLTNEQLAGVADRWDALDQDQRRWFFAEVRKRLTADGGAADIPIRSNVRFGQVVRARDGTVVRIGKVEVARQPRAAASRNDPRAYGFGFERRRSGQREPMIPIVRPEPLPAAVRLPASSRRDSRPADGGP